MSDEFSPEVKRAYRLHRAAEEAIGQRDITSIIVDAFVHERAMRLKAEWQRSHSCARTADWGNNPSYTHCADPRHDWIDEQWRASVEEELSR